MTKMFRRKGLLFLIIFIFVPVTSECINKYKYIVEALLDCRNESNHDRDCKCKVPSETSKKLKNLTLRFNVSNCTWKFKGPADSTIFKSCQEESKKYCWPGYVDDELNCTTNNFSLENKLKDKETILCYNITSCKPVTVKCKKKVGGKFLEWSFDNKYNESWSIKNENLQASYYENGFKFICEETFGLESTTGKALCENGIIKNRPKCIIAKSILDWKLIIIGLIVILIIFALFITIYCKKYRSNSMDNRNSDTNNLTVEYNKNENLKRKENTENDKREHSDPTTEVPIYQVVDINSKRKNKLTPIEDNTTNNQDVIYQVVDLNTKRKNNPSPNRHANEATTSTNEQNVMYQVLDLNSKQNNKVVPIDLHEKVEMRNNPPDAEYVVIDLQNNPKNKYDSRLYESMSDYEQFYEKFAPKK